MTSFNSNENKINNEDKINNENKINNEASVYANDYLAKKNPHERDFNISFEAGPHIYTINNERDKKYTSVTTWNHKHFRNFDPDAVIESMMNSKNWQNSAYYGKTPEEIKAGWNKSRDEAAAAGTKMHYDIECYYNKNTVDNNSIEYKYFTQFLETCPSLIPYRTEWMIYHEELQLAGSIDMVYKEPDDSLMIYDWKRCKEIKKTDNFLKFAQTDCISHLPDTNYWHYALQLNTYKAIIEEKYGKRVSKLYLVCLHPNNINKTFQIIPVPDLQNEVKELFSLRKLELI